MTATDYKSEKEQISVIESLYNQDRFSEALFLVEKAISEFPMSFQGKFLHLRILKKLGREDAYYQGLIDLNQMFPENLTLILELGESALQKRQFAESLSYFQKAQFLDSFNSVARERIARIHKIQEALVNRKLEDTAAEIRPDEIARPSEPESTPPAEIPYAPAKTQIFSPLDPSLSIRSATRPETDAGKDTEERPMVEFGVTEEPEVAPEFSEPAFAEFPAEVNVVDFGEEHPPVVEEEPSQGAPGPVAEPAFETASAADLYYQQGCYPEALAIYEKLASTSGDPRHQEMVSVIRQAMAARVKMSQVEKLMRFRQLFQKRGKAVV